MTAHLCSMKITEDVRKYAAEQEALQSGMEEESREFVEKGGELYANGWCRRIARLPISGTGLVFRLGEQRSLFRFLQNPR